MAFYEHKIARRNPQHPTVSLPVSGGHNCSRLGAVIKQNDDWHTGL